GLVPCGASVCGRSAQSHVRGRRADERESDERPADARRYALPVPLRIQAQQVARSRIEEEVPLRKEDLVEEEEQRIERQRRSDANDQNDPRGGETRVPNEHRCPPLPARTGQAKGDDAEGEDRDRL